MADQQNRGGQKVGSEDPAHSQQHRAPNSDGGRSDADKQRDQRDNPDDAARQPTDRQR